jgi:hypothetical protein
MGVEARLIGEACRFAKAPAQELLANRRYRRKLYRMGKGGGP